MTLAERDEQIPRHRRKRPLPLSRRYRAATAAPSVKPWYAASQLADAVNCLVASKIQTSIHHSWGSIELRLIQRRILMQQFHLG